MGRAGVVMEDIVEVCTIIELSLEKLNAHDSEDQNEQGADKKHVAH